MQKQKIILIVGIILGVIAVVMINVYLRQQRQIVRTQAQKQIAQMQANQSAVLVAKNDIAKGTRIDADMLEAVVVPNKYLQPQAVTSLDRVSGMIAIAPISKDEQITLTKLTQTRSAAGGLAEATPIGKRAVTIAVDNISSLAGMIKPGDYVDVIALVAIPMQTPDGQRIDQAAVMPLFQNILVLAVGQQLGAITQEGGSRYARQDEAKESSPLITLALTPQEASLIAFVQEQGKIRLSLRSPADSDIQPVYSANWDALFRYIAPKDAVSAEPAGIEPSEFVEIYRGMNKERIPLSGK